MLTRQNLHYDAYLFDLDDLDMKQSDFSMDCWWCNRVEISIRFRNLLSDQVLWFFVSTRNS